MKPENLLEVRDLQTHFFTEDGVVRAVAGVTFSVKDGSTVGIVGESGSGKSITAYSILQVVGRPGRIMDGEVLFRKDGEVIDLMSLPPESKALRDIRGGAISMIFQEPMNSLSPVHTIGEQIIEGILLHTQKTKAEAREHAIDMLRLVGIPDAARRIDNYTFELSGGMRQRAMIAAALACRPALLIADEPTTALDVTTQAQILDLIADMQKEMGMSVMLITHDLGVVAEVCDNVVVMYLGEVVEQSDVVSLFERPKHPYTKALMRSLPRLGEGKDQVIDPIEGSVPDPLSRPRGCRFHPRCDEAVAGVCDKIVPRLVTMPDGRTVRCVHFDEELELNG